jgi:hypothetical protein
MNTNFRRNALYGMLIMGKPTVRKAVLALTFVSSVLPFAVGWFLGIPLWGVFLGVLVASGLSFIFGVAASTAALALDRLNDYLVVSDKIALVLGSLSLVLGLSFFIGFSAALIIGLAPMMITVPASYGLRAWSLHRYGTEFEEQLDELTN